MAASSLPPLRMMENDVYVNGKNEVYLDEICFSYVRADEAVSSLAACAA